MIPRGSPRNLGGKLVDAAAAGTSWLGSARAETSIRVRLAPNIARSWSRGRGSAGKQRLAEREVEMDRSGRVATSRLHGARCRRPRVTNERVVSNRNGHVDKPLDVAAKELDLVDRLRRAPVAQLRRSIRGQDEERDAAQARFDDCRQEIRRGGS